MAMNDENCPPHEEDDNISVSSVKAGAAVFGNLLFGSEFPDHSLCYSPSPMVSRHNAENILPQPMDGKVLSFDKPAASPNKPIDVPSKKPAAAKAQARAALRQNVPKSKALPQRKKPVGLPRKATVYKMQDSNEDLGGNSVNPIINGVRRSKEENLKEKMMSVAELRERRRQERDEVAAFNVKAEQTRREVIELRKKLNERFRQAKVEREQRLRAERLAKVENEIQFKSRVHVEHKRTLKEQEDMRRRMSTDARARLRQNHREGKERMRLTSIQEDQALYEERHESSVAMRNAKKDNAEKRRNSFAFRNGDARRIRDLFAKREAERMQEEHESYELKWAGERDAEDYQQQMAQERRDSLAFRNAEGQRIRDLEGQMAADAQHDEHESYELKWAGERDAEDYQRQMAQERRESLRFRNEEASRHDAVMRELQSLAQEKEHESFVLKWAGENDTKQYLSDEKELRRLSLAFRNAEGKRHRDIDEEERVRTVVEGAQNEELNAACQRDVQCYQEECAAKDRASLQMKGMEKFSSRMQEENRKQIKLQEDHESHLLDTAAWQDVNDYIKECKRRKRLSLAFRAKEKRRHALIEREQAREKIHQQHIDTLYRSEDARSVEMAMLKEKARVALEAFNRSPTCTFGAANPFAPLLD